MRRSTAGTPTPKAAPSPHETASTSTLLEAACVRLPEVSKVQKPTMTLNANSASTQFRAVRCSARSVTWPELRSSLTTRISAAGEVDMASEASSSDVNIAAPKARAVANTATKVAADSSRPVAASQGLTRTQRRLMR